MKNFLFLILVLLSFPSLAEEAFPTYDRVVAKNEIVCGLMPWAPYSEQDLTTKEWKGSTVDILRRAFSTLDMKVTFKTIVQGNQVQDLNMGRVDAICEDGPWTMSAGKFVEFSQPYYAVAVYLYGRADEKRFHTRADLNNPNVHFIGMDGDLSSDLARRLFPKAKVSSMPGTSDVSQLYVSVMSNKVDMVIADPASFVIFNKNNPGQLKLLALGDDKPVGLYKSSISVRKGDYKMLGLVNQAVDNALSFGLIDEVLDRVDPKRTQFMRVESRYIIPTERK